MKKTIILLLIILIFNACSTYYGKYDNNRYFEKFESVITFYGEEAAASFIAGKLNRILKHNGQQTLYISSFTDENGDTLIGGDMFAKKIVSAMTPYRDIKVVEDKSLFEVARERELTLKDLIDNNGYELEKLLNVKSILHGRIMKSGNAIMISIRCFETGTGSVIYATIIRIDFSPERVYELAPQQTLPDQKPPNNPEKKVIMPGDVIVF